MKLFGSVLLILVLANISFADERIRPRAVLLKEGYLPMTAFRNNSVDLTSPIAIAIAEHSMEWPVQFQDSAHSLGNVMAQFQPFDTPPYYHAGCDLRVKRKAQVFAPVDGRLEAGHYSYTDNEDGSAEKFWKPWPEMGDTTYFEVAVIDDNNIRYELHHMDRDSLSPEVLTILRNGGGRIQKGALLGNAIAWPGGDYHHVHYNVVLPNLVYVNPEYISVLIPDHLPPKINESYAVTTSGKVVNFGNGVFTDKIKEFVISVIDKQDNNVYEHPPALVAITPAVGTTTGWDFRQSLSKQDGSFPPLNDFFAFNFRTPSGRRISTTGGYGTGTSVVRLPVATDAAGDFIIDIGDISGNVSHLTGHFN